MPPFLMQEAGYKYGGPPFPRTHIFTPGKDNHLILRVAIIKERKKWIMNISQEQLIEVWQEGGNVTKGQWKSCRNFGKQPANATVFEIMVMILFSPKGDASPPGRSLKPQLLLAIKSGAALEGDSLDCYSCFISLYFA